MIEATKKGGQGGTTVEKPKEGDSAAEVRAEGEVLVVGNSATGVRQPRPRGLA